MHARARRIHVWRRAESREPQRMCIREQVVDIDDVPIVVAGRPAPRRRRPRIGQSVAVGTIVRNAIY